MKKYILSIFVCVLGLSHIQADNISVPNVTIEPGQSATVAISLENNEANLVSFQMDLTLPTGISINKSGCSLSSRFTDEDQELTIGKQGTNVYRLTSTSFALIPITGTSGEIITLTLTASDNSEGGTATLSNIRFVTSESGKVVVSDASFSITVATPSPAITFVDSNVKDLCVANWDTNDDGELSLDEAAAVTSLGEVFRGNTEITSFDEISYFTGLTGFDDDAFNGCSGLTSFTIPSNITSIGRRAFQNCSSLASITIPESVTDIYYHAFSYCTGITSITVDPGNGVYDSRYDCNAIIKTSANQLVAGCKNTIIPDNVTRIGNYAFLGCSDLTSITIPESVTAIGNSAFYDCSNLASIEIPNSVTSIESAAFRKCSSLTTVTVDMDTPLEIDNLVFATPANATLFVPIGSKTAYETADNWKEFGTIVEYGNITFADGNVKELCVANWDTDDDGELSLDEAAAVTSLGEVFKGNTEITSFDELAYFTGMTTISADAFSGCTSLTSVKLPSTVTSIGHGAFWSCGQLASIDFNGCKASIKYDAFGYCTSLVNVTLPSGTYPDGHNCFYGCTSLKSFVMEASDNLPDSWSGGTFDLCSNLETAVVYGKVLRGPNNFKECTSLQTVTYLDSTPGTNYNQNFRGAASGIQFIIPEGSAETFLRQGYVNLSDKSALPIAREEFEDEVARIEAMATAAGSDATALSQAISEARTIVNNATDYPTVFAQIAAVKEAAREFLATATLTDEFDVTAAYVTNPDITRFDIGWQTSSGWMTAGYQTASYTNGDVSIDHFVEMQKGDGALPDGEINQTISQLPAGKYRLEADVIAANALSDAEVTGVSLFLGGESTVVVTEDMKPQHFSVEFTNNETQDVEFGINIASTTANWVAADNFRLYYLQEKIIEFADENVKTLCVANWDTSGDGELSEAEASAVTELGEVFKGNTEITSFDELQYFTGLTTIGNDAFRDCSGLTSVTIPNSVTSIGEWSFMGCIGLTSIVIPANVTSIYGNSFAGCVAMEQMSVDPSNSVYDSRNGCNAIIETSTDKLVAGCQTTQIPDGIETIGNCAFDGRWEMQKMAIPETVTTIEDYAFVWCISLSSITLPASVSVIGNGVFNSCENLTSIQCKMETPPSISEDVFTNRANATLFVPVGSKAAYQAADYWKEFKAIFEGDLPQENVEPTDVSAIDNVIYMEPIEATKGGEVTVPILMKNTTPIRGFQFDMYLPDGVTVKINSYNRLDCSLSSDRLPSGSAHTLTVSEQQDGAIRFLCGSQYDETFTGSDGEILTVRLCLDEHLLDGQYPIVLKNVKMTETTINNFYLTETVQTALNVIPYIPGDISGDGVIDVSDYIGVANYILGTSQEGITAAAADVNKDKLVDVSDYIGVANLILYNNIYGQTVSASRSAERRRVNTDVSTLDNVIYISPFEAVSNGETQVSIRMKNTVGIRGFQFDLYLPDGMTAVKDGNNRYVSTLSNGRKPAGDQHTLTLSEQPDGAIRFLCGSQYDETFTGTDGEIATLTISIDAAVEAEDYPIYLRNMKLTETDINNFYTTNEIETSVTVTGPADGRVILRETATSLPVVDETEEVDVVVYRTLKAGEWSTICLPFDMDEDQLKEFFGDEVQLAKFDKYTATKTGSDVTGITISFTAVDLADDGFEANVPYIIKPSKTEDITSFELTTMVAADDVKDGSNKKGWFYGTYEAETVVPENSLFLNGNKFYYSTGKTKMKAFRAYFTLPVVLADVSNASSRIALSFEETTDVKELKSSRIEGLKSYYNLKGQRVEAPVKKGLYIRDGKKMVIK
jgi:hypothetical protein